MTGSRSRLALALRALLAAAWFALCFFVALPATVLWASGAPFPPPLGLGAALGVSLILLAHYVLLQHVAAFVDIGEGTHAPFDPPRKLVVRGLYRRVRNPMYLIYTFIIAGEALVFASWELLLYAFAFLGVAHLYVTTVEEKQLAARFGDEWSAYARDVRRWLPGRPRE